MERRKPSGTGKDIPDKCKQEENRSPNMTSDKIVFRRKDIKVRQGLFKVVKGSVHSIDHTK